jgi:3-oxoacyl-[acyl-carrier-protein] synthase-3
MTALPLHIAGLGHYLPARIVSNEEVEARCALPAGWIKARTGVCERRWVTGESNSFMAGQAALEALAQAGLEPDQIDLILNASGTQEQAIPDGGPLLQNALGLSQSGVPCFTIHATCLSFLAAVEVAASLLSSQRYRHILIVSSEIASCGLNFAEPESAALMGDGAAAVVISRPPPGRPASLHASRIETYGAGSTFAEIRGGGTAKHPAGPTTTPADNLFHMNGPQLLKLTRRYSRDFLERLQPGLSQGLGDIKLVIPHQASLLGLRLLRFFGWPDEQVMVTLNRYGNCVAASIPLALYEAVKQGRVKRGDKILLVGTGAGLSLGGLILTY